MEDVQTHLEPLERPLQARQPRAPARPTARVARGRGARARAHRARPPSGCGCSRTDAGRVLFLTLAGREGESLTDAHRLASELEDELRAALGGLADVVIHTEP